MGEHYRLVGGGRIVIFQHVTAEGHLLLGHGAAWTHSTTGSRIVFTVFPARQGCTRTRHYVAMIRNVCATAEGELLFGFDVDDLIAREA